MTILQVSVMGVEIMEHCVYFMVFYALAKLKAVVLLRSLLLHHYHQQRQWITQYHDLTTEPKTKQFYYLL